MIQASKVLVIVGSVRARRICPQVAEWVAQVGREILSQPIEVVDLKDWPLPMNDEPGIPAMGHYEFEPARGWSRKISEGAAIVFVTPQYNWGYPAALKNAIDHLYNEWANKPALIVTYGGHGGGKCASQLKQVLEGIHMKPVSTMPGLKLSRENIEANTGLLNPGLEFAEHQAELKQAFWELSHAMKVNDAAS